LISEEIFWIIKRFVRIGTVNLEAGQLPKFGGSKNLFSYMVWLFGVWGLGFGVWGLGFGVWGLGFRV
jgi:hypothetical protein